MKLKFYVWGMILISLVLFIAFYLVVKNVDPARAGIAGKALFYLILFFSLSGLFNLLLLGTRRVFLGKDLAIYGLNLSLRQGILLSILAVALLILQSYRMLVWWDGLLVLAGVFLIELYFLSRK